MKYFSFYRMVLTLFMLLFSTQMEAQVITLDEFENTEGWTFIRSDGVDLNIRTEKGLTGNAIRFDYDFTNGTGYGWYSKVFFP